MTTGIRLRMYRRYAHLLFLVYPDRIEENIRRMIKIAKGARNLRPHVKTHKMAEIVMLQMKHGITKFKCATISETEMVASMRSS